MAFYTALEKQSEDSESVTYKFGPGDGRWGLIKFDKQARDYLKISDVPGTTHENHLEHAILKLIRVVKAGEGFPDVLEYAA